LSDRSQSRASAARNCWATCIGADRSRYRTPAALSVFGRYQAGLGQQGQVLGDRLPRDR
jgi:hypothetical protein